MHSLSRFLGIRHLVSDSKLLSVRQICMAKVKTHTNIKNGLKFVDIYLHAMNNN